MTNASRGCRLCRNRRGGFVLPAALLFLTCAFAMWAVLHRGSSSLIRLEQARELREGRNTFAAPAMAAALRLLETGEPPAVPYACKVAVSLDGQTRYFRLSFDRIATARWTVAATPTTADDIAPDAPGTFFHPSDNGNGGGGEGGGVGNN